MNDRLVVNTFNDFKYRQFLKDRCNLICNVALDYLDSNFNNKYEMFIFGSYAKFLVTEDSDLDIFVVIDSDLSLKEIRDIRINMSMYIGDHSDYIMDFDLKIISRYYFEKALENPTSFETHINSYMFKFVRR